MSKYTIAFVSKDTSFNMPEDNEQFAHIANCKKHAIELMYFSNNTQPLANVYNQVLDKSSESDYVILMHSDVICDMQHLLDHIEECKDKYDVMGLCGTSIMNVSQSPLNWWTGSNPTPNAKWGCVTHGELGNNMSFFNAHSPDVTDHKVACIDGLCIIFTKKAIDAGLRFDPLFTFDFYDSDISFQALLKYKLRLGVIIEKSLQHYSVGRSITTQDFLKHEIDFRNKWGLDVPADSAISKLQQS